MKTSTRKVRVVILKKNIIHESPAELAKRMVKFNLHLILLRNVQGHPSTSHLVISCVYLIVLLPMEEKYFIVHITLTGTHRIRPIVLSTSLGKTLFAWRFILNEIILFWLTISLISETICLFCFCVLFSNMNPKIKFTAKKWSDLCNFYSKVNFRNFYLRNFSLLNLNYWCFTTYCENFRKI